MSNESRESEPALDWGRKLNLLSERASLLFNPAGELFDDRVGEGCSGGI